MPASSPGRGRPHASHPGSVVPLTMNVCSLTIYIQGGFFFNLKRAPLNIQEHASRPPEFLVTPPGKDICKIKDPGIIFCIFYAPLKKYNHLLCPPEYSVAKRKNQTAQIMPILTARFRGAWLTKKVTDSVTGTQGVQQAPILHSLILSCRKLTCQHCPIWQRKILGIQH